MTEVGSRARVGLLAGQPLVAEITGESLARLGLAPGSRRRRDVEGDRDQAGRPVSAELSLIGPTTTQEEP